MKSIASRLFAPAAASLLFACIVDKAPKEQEPPRLSYADNYADTVGVAASHAPVLGGGPIARFRVQPALPEGLGLDSATGVISGTPEEASELEEYHVIASGPGGSDTAWVGLAVIDTTRDIPDDTTGTAIDSYAGLILTLKASPGFRLARMVLEYRSSHAPDSLITDTLMSGEGGLSTTSNSDQTVTRAAVLKPLRNWTIRARVLDGNDSVIYLDSVTVNALLIGETRAVSLNLEPRYRNYLAKFSLPDSLSSVTGGFKQVLNINRFRATVGSVSALDTQTAPAYFTPNAQHVSGISYVPAHATQTRIGVRFHGSIDPWPAEKPLFADTVQMDAGVDSVYTFAVQWTGPGSAWDPNWDSSNPSGAMPSLTVTVGPLRVVEINPSLPPNPLPKKKH